MEKLFMDMKNENVPIEQDIVQKYNLQRGTLSPFTKSRIVGKDGEFSLESHIEKDSIKENGASQAGKDAGLSRLPDGIEFTTSEIIDFSQGADSD